MLEQKTFTLVSDDDYRYFEDMESFMDSGLKAEIISIDTGDEEEFAEGYNFDTHGRVLVLIRNLMIKKIPNELGDVIDAVAQSCLERADIKKRQKERISEILNRKKKESKLKREKLFKLACYRSSDLEMRTNLVRMVSYLYFANGEEMSNIFLPSVLLALAYEVV